MMVHYFRKLDWMAEGFHTKNSLALLLVAGAKA